jgi:hypothetical protein
LVGAVVGGRDKHSASGSAGQTSGAYWPAGQPWQQPKFIAFAEVSSPPPRFCSIFILKPQMYVPDGHDDERPNDPHPQLHPS